MVESSAQNGSPQGEVNCFLDLTCGILMGVPPPVQGFIRHGHRVADHLAVGETEIPVWGSATIATALKSLIF